MGKTLLNWEEFRSTDCLFQLKNNGISAQTWNPAIIEADSLDWTGTPEWDKIPFMERFGQPVEC